MDLLDRIENHFGVEREVIIAIWGIESRFGSHRGSFNVFETLNTLFDAYPRRSSFFREQLVYFLIVCRENNMDPLKIKGSYAGAFGQTQFIPSSFHEYAVSFDDDAIRDVFNSTEDVLASIANYLRRFGWTLNAPVMNSRKSASRSAARWTTGWFPQPRVLICWRPLRTGNSP